MKIFRQGEDVFPREVADWAPTPEELYRVCELRDILINALEGLRPILRTVFVLRDIEELSIDQTAEILHLTPLRSQGAALASPVAASRNIK